MGQGVQMLPCVKVVLEWPVLGGTQRTEARQQHAVGVLVMPEKVLVQEAGGRVPEGSGMPGGPKRLPTQLPAQLCGQVPARRLCPQVPRYRQGAAGNRVVLFY